MKTDKMEIINKITRAELVLVGIGEEFESEKKGLFEKEEYEEGLKRIERSREKWGWLMPYLENDYLERYGDERVREAYLSLEKILAGKNYFIVTTCMDGAIYKTGLDRERIVSPCGGYSLLQCSAKCNEELMDAVQFQDLLMRAVREGNWDELRPPRCEKCGGILQFNNVYAEAYNENGYLPMWEKYKKWLQGTLNRNVCVLELGVGMRFPGVIRFPFEKAAFFNRKADFIRIHERLYQISEELKEKGISAACDAVEFFGNMGE